MNETYAWSLQTYGSKRLRLKKFNRFSEKRQLNDTVRDRCFPEMDSVIILGNGNIQVNMRVRLYAQIGKYTRVLGLKRRLKFANETYVTTQSVRCRNLNCENKIMYDNLQGHEMLRSEKEISVTAKVCGVPNMPSDLK